LHRVFAEYRTPVDRQLLTAAFPVTAANAPNGPATGCQAAASDYGASAPGMVDAYAVNLLLDRVVLTDIRPPQGSAGSQVGLFGEHFPSSAVTVVFENGSSSTTAQSIPEMPENPRKAGVKVPALSPGLYKVSIRQGGLPGPVSQPVNFTVQ